VNPYPYQQAGVEWLTSRPAGILADEPGLGKTCQALLACRHLGLERVLIVCPASLRLNWQREAERWIGISPWVLLPGAGSMPATGWAVVNYDLLKRVPVGGPPWDGIIFDEAHYLKNIKAKRTQLALGLKACRRYMLTGTPLLSHPEELWPLLAAVDYATWKDRSAYVRRYAPPFTIRVRGQFIDRYGRANEAELAERIRPVMLRRRKADVLPDLPPKTVSTVAIDSELPEYPDKLDVQDFARIRHEEAVLRAPAAREYLSDLLAGGIVPLVVWFWHRDVGEFLHSELRGSVLVHGGTPAVARDAAVQAFQAGQVPVFLGQIQAAGVGLTLTAASRAVFVERHWTPALNVQAEDRIHRIGQKDHVQIDVLVVPGSTDDILGRTLAQKNACTETVLGDDIYKAMQAWDLLR
jgi:SWI/SNF-related matrix-associated actin-dependent regulator 1 of chromatin subfamily A